MNSNLPMTDRDEKKESSLSGVWSWSLTVVSKSNELKRFSLARSVKPMNAARKITPPDKNTKLSLVK